MLESDELKNIDKNIKNLFSEKQELARLDYNKEIHKKSYNHKLKKINEKIISLTDEKKKILVRYINYKLSQEDKDRINNKAEKKEKRGRKKMPYKKRILKVLNKKNHSGYDDVVNKVLKYFPSKDFKNVLKDVRYIVSQIKKGGTKKYGDYRWDEKNFRAVVKKQKKL